MVKFDLLSYVIVAIISALFSSILTEHLITKRIQYTEGIKYMGGKCRLLPGYGKLNTITTNTITK